MHVKWVTRLRFTDQESDHTSQIPHYRTPRVPIEPGEPFTPTYENSEPNWRMKIKCVVLSPKPGDTLPRGDFSVAGVAFNDGEARIETVLVSVDQGRAWQQAQLEVPESPYAWHRWTARIEISPTTRQIWARAIDALGRSQPLDGAVHWNPAGYTWNGMEKIDVKVQA
jgi:DMSO/TMAO reductase YedYZ molybdopterin-dependent catalytic subunit